jgi:hypothetical protein
MYDGSINFGEELQIGLTLLDNHYPPFQWNKSPIGTTDGNLEIFIRQTTLTEIRLGELLHKPIKFTFV